MSLTALPRVWQVVLWAGTGEYLFPSRSKNLVTQVNGCVGSSVTAIFGAQPQPTNATEHALFIYLLFFSQTSSWGKLT